jgi:hypothetical protein
MAGIRFLIPMAILAWAATSPQAAGPAWMRPATAACAGEPATRVTAAGDQVAQGCPPQPRCGPGERTCNVRVDENGCILWDCCPR